MGDYFKNYIKYKTKYLKLKETWSAGAPPKMNKSDSAAVIESALTIDSISALEAQFLRRDGELHDKLREVITQIDLLREEIRQNRDMMVLEISKLRDNLKKTVVDVDVVADAASVAEVDAGTVKKESTLVTAFPKRNISNQPSGSISSQLNAILIDKSLEGPDKLSEKLIKLDTIYLENKDLCDTTGEKGLVTLLLRYACLKRDENLIGGLIGRLSMTRDFLLLMSYYNDRRGDNIELFKRKINLDKIDQSNIDFILEKELSYLLPLLEGRFIKLGVRDGLVNGSTVEGLRHLYIPDVDFYIDRICNYKMEVGEGKEKDKLLIVECSTSQKRDRKKMQSLIEAENDYDVIIDGGNLMHVGGGKNVVNIVNASRELVRLGKRPIVILYHKHTKDSAVVSELSRNHIKYISTPGANDDDIFTLLAFLNNSKKGRPCNILTNDKYKKWFAVYKHTSEGQEKNLEGFITDVLLEYRIEIDNTVNILTPILPYSQCIQVVGSNVYLPTTTFGMFKSVSI